MSNQEILHQNIGKTLSIRELIDLGFKDDKVIKQVINEDNLLLRKIIYHPVTEYSGCSLIVTNNEKFYIKPNNLSQKEAESQNNLRDKKKHLEDLKDTYWAYAFEFKDKEMAELFKSKIEKQERRIKATEKAIKIGNELRKYKDDPSN